MNNLALVRVSEFNSKTRKTTNKHGVQSLYLSPIAGELPNRQVLDGTVAEGLGIKTETTILVSCREIESDPVYGRQFTYTNLGEMSGLDIIKVVKELGPGKVIEVSSMADTPITEEEFSDIEN